LNDVNQAELTVASLNRTGRLQIGHGLRDGVWGAVSTLAIGERVIFRSLERASKDTDVPADDRSRRRFIARVEA
jgi:hypothetical protein